MDSYGRDQNTNQVVIYTGDFRTDAQKYACLDACYARYSTAIAGCEISESRYCVAHHNNDVKMGSGTSQHICAINRSYGSVYADVA